MKKKQVKKEKPIVVYSPSLGLKQLKDMLKSWIDTDIVQATKYFQRIEKYDPTYARGWRSGIWSVMEKIDELNEEFNGKPIS